MKNVICLTLLISLLVSCSSEVDLKDHIQKSGDTYCTYRAVGAGKGSFMVCIYCPTGAALCGTLSKVRILREYHLFMPNEYDHFTLTSEGQGCSDCTGIFYWEKE